MPVAPFDAQSQIIPLVVDYILVHEVAEVESLAFTLQLNENEVRKSLLILERHNILSAEEVCKEYFMNKFVEKLNLQEWAKYDKENQKNQKTNNLQLAGLDPAIIANLQMQ